MFFFCFSKLLLGTIELKSLLLALQNGPEGIKRGSRDLSFHSWPGNSCGCERCRHKKIGHPQKYKQDRQSMTGICPPMQPLVIHSGIGPSCPNFFWKEVLNPYLRPCFLFLGWLAGMRDVWKKISILIFSICLIKYLIV